MKSKPEVNNSLFKIVNGKISDGETTYSLEDVVNIMNNDQLQLGRFNKLLSHIPECEDHGTECIPGAIEWIKEKVAEGNNNPAIEALRYALESDMCEDDTDRVNFLRLWFNADFPEIREEWKNIPDEVFIGADPLFARENG